MTRSHTLCALMFLGPSLLGAATESDTPPPAGSACVTCHLELEGQEEGPAQQWAADVHAQAGLGCESCHGGDASPDLAEDLDAAKDDETGFALAPDRLAVPEFCGNCHADARFMKQYNPQARVDQLAEYRTSGHGQSNAAGDPTPAVCTDCHGAHGIQPVSSPASAVYATNVPGTCAACHSDTDKMAPYQLPTDQYASYLGSVHATALFEMEDIAAPACNDCHGNHGATPPGVQSVANVCGQCHARESRLFRASFKKELFENMEVSECTVCHDHHRILHPTPDLFHFASEPTVSRGEVTRTEPFEADLGGLGAGESATATWLATLGPHVSAEDERLLHHIEISVEGEEPLLIDATVRPGSLLPAEERSATGAGLSARLSIEAPAGPPVQAGDSLIFHLEVSAERERAGVLIRDRLGEGIHPVKGSACLTCHSPGDDCDQASERMYDALISLERELREAESLLHLAEVRGMEVSGPQFELKSQGTTAAVETRALIHAFDADRLVERTEEGKAVTATALQAARAALEELEVRRKGLAVSLVLVALVLIGLFLKIRQIDRNRRTQGKATVRAG